MPGFLTMAPPLGPAPLPRKCGRPKRAEQLARPPTPSLALTFYCIARAAAKADKLFRDRGIHPRAVDRSAAVVATALVYDMLQLQLAAVGAS